MYVGFDRGLAPDRNWNTREHPRCDPTRIQIKWMQPVAPFPELPLVVAGRLAGHKNSRCLCGSEGLEPAQSAALLLA